MKQSRLRLLVVGVMAVGVVTLPSTPATGSFPGQNGKIVFVTSGGAPVDSDLWEMKPNGDDQSILLNDEFANADPQVSPNGKRVAYTDVDAIWVVNANGNNPHVISPNVAEDPAWVGNDRIVFSRGGELFIRKADGSGRPRLLLKQETAADEQEPDWSAVNNRIAYMSTVEGFQAEIFTVKLDGSKKKQLTNNDVYDGDPDWHPELKKMSYTCRPGPSPEYEVCAMPASGEGDVINNLTNTELHEESEASWSPNGAFLVYERQTDGETDTDIWRMKANGDNQNAVTVNPYNDDNPDWQAL
jgi:Tol biopolymer transport system component